MRRRNRAALFLAATFLLAGCASSEIDEVLPGGIFKGAAVADEPLAAMWNPDSELLACSSRSLHDAYRISMSLLTTGLAIAWYRFTGYMRKRRATGGRIALAKWGGLAWVVIIFMVTMMPWRLLYDNDHARALIDGEPAYILMETEAELLIYRPGNGSAERLSTGEGLQVERLGTLGYLFEDPSSFMRDRPGC